ncbi:hypothetical protein Cme02nite_23360 [Catellatospora methionotrophica]|uniref:Uncharacterized protein n=1 Tax=Catellatospora methionotrophica TaxID=121620 RepID=A0A8J3LEG4_9ACTN|nr:hypothetical protein [Catellatospora methionotrophica]GIG14004.1 hypothetical protein Cme02nite_23360 [Catellatospora methionotrophica]
MTRQLFDEVIGEVPAPAVDVDRIIRRERRGAAARRFGLASTGGLALLAVGALVLGQGLAGAPTPTTVPATSDATPAVTDGFRLVYATPEEAAQSARRISAELDRAVLAAAPDRQWLFFPSAPGDPQQPDGKPPVVRFVDKPVANGEELQLFAGRSGIASGGRKGSLSLYVAPHAVGGPPVPVTTRRDESAPGGVYLSHTVSVMLADGRVLVVAVHNRSYTRKLAPAFQEETPLSVAQLQAIADAVAAKVLA